MSDLLEQIVNSKKLSSKEKRKKLKKFKEAYPDIYRSRFPREEDEPDCMTNGANKSRRLSGGSLAGDKPFNRLPSISKIKHAMRI